MQIFGMIVLSIGKAAHELLDSGAMITFLSTAPPELQEFSVIVEPEPLESPIQPGDIFTVNSHSFQILAIGDIANKNIAELAHAVWMFDGKDKAEMPSEIHLEKSALPELQPGDRLIIERNP